MSLKAEQYRALLLARAFLRDLAMPGYSPKVSEMRDRARACLRHFPDLTGEGEPLFSNDSFEPIYRCSLDNPSDDGHFAEIVNPWEQTNCAVYKPKYEVKESDQLPRCCATCLYCMREYRRSDDG